MSVHLYIFLKLDAPNLSEEFREKTAGNSFWSLTTAERGETQKMTSRRYFPVKNNKNFSWHDDGTVKDRRRPNEKHYRFFFKILFTTET